MFKDSKPHGLVSLQFLCALDIFLGGDISLSKEALTVLYYNLSFEMLSGSRSISFDKISDLTADMSFQMKHSVLSNLKRKIKQDKKSNTDIKILMNSLKSPETMKNLKKKKKKKKKKIFLRSSNT